MTLAANETTAKWLGYAGLIPFVIFSIGSWTSLPLVADSTQMLITYAAIIMAFMGAIHWGLSLASIDANQSKHLVASNATALAAWSALLLPQIFALILLTTGFLLLLGYDLTVARARTFPDWYVTMRIRLTLVVSICLTAGISSLAIN
jgi:hypothetical protein